MNMSSPIELPVETLNALREALPHGAMEQIAKKAGFSRQYVYQILSGASKINNDNYCVITEAQSIIRQTRETVNKINSEIKKTLE